MDVGIQLFKFYDLGGPLTRGEIVETLNNLKKEDVSLSRYQVKTFKNEPDYVNYPEPVAFTLENEINIFQNKYDIECKVFTYGALSLKVNISPDFTGLEELVRYVGEKEPAEDIERGLDRIYERLFDNLVGRLKKKYRSRRDISNLYPVYCLSDTGYEDVAELVKENETRITSLLSGLFHRRDFSQAQIKKVMSDWSRFYKDDYSIIHWNAALAIDNSGDYDDLLFIIELANIQFIKLRAYDDYIDNYLSEYLKRTKGKLGGNTLNIFYPQASRMMGEITRMRVEIEQVTDMMDNFEKFFGKWYLAKIYYLASGAFEIPRWRRLMSSRLDTVDELYTMLYEEKNRKKMLLLNFLTFLLFILWFVTG